MKLNDNVTVLGDSHFHLYLLGSDPALILEGGVSAVLPLIKEQVKALNSINVKNIILMHAHFDHVCGTPGLQKIFPLSQVAATPEAKKILSRPKIVAGFFKEDEFLYQSLGVERNPKDFQCAPRPDVIEVDRLIEDGERWKLGKLTLDFHYAPGHSYCSLIAYQPEEEILFSSDSAGFPIDEKRVFPIFFTGYEDYQGTIKRMKKLPVKILAGAHEQIIHGEKQVGEFLAMAAAEAEKVMSYVLGAWRRGDSQEKIAADLYNNYYTGQLKIYSTQNIITCCKLLTLRSLQAAGVQLE